MGLLYVGKNPDEQTNNVVTKQYSDTYAQNNSVSSLWLTEEADTATSTKISQSDVDTAVNAQNAGKRLYPTRTQITTDQNRYLDVALLGNPQGIARTDSTGVLDLTNHIPANISRDNPIISYDAIAQAGTYEGNVFLLSSNVVTGTSSDAYEAANFTIPDPGYSYYPVNLVYIKGKSSGTSERTLGTGNMGKINVTTRATAGPQVFYASGVCAGTPYPNYYAALPHTTGHSGNPPSRPPTAVTGKLQLSLYLTNYEGSGYTFYSEGLMWAIIVFPVVSQGN